MNGFIRGQNPKDAMGIGASGKVKKWLGKNNTSTDNNYPALNNHYCRIEGSKIIVEFNGNIVLENLDIEKDNNIKGKFEIDFSGVAGNITILNQLDKDELYKRIKDFYNKVLYNCLGKTIEEQADYLYGKNETAREKWLNRLEGAIENSKTYIRNLPVNPTKKQMNKLAEQVIFGELEYGYPAKDENGVKMEQYAKALERLTSTK